MKTVLSKLKALIVVLLIFALIPLGIWLIGLVGGLINQNGLIGTLSFAILALAVVLPIVYFMIKNLKQKHSEKNSIMKEKMFNEIRKKHSSS